MQFEIQEGRFVHPEVDFLLAGDVGSSYAKTYYGNEDLIKDFQLSNSLDKQIRLLVERFPGHSAFNNHSYESNPEIPASLETIAKFFPEHVRLEEDEYGNHLEGAVAEACLYIEEGKVILCKKSPLLENLDEAAELYREVDFCGNRAFLFPLNDQQVEEWKERAKTGEGAIEVNTLDPKYSREDKPVYTGRSLNLDRSNVEGSLGQFLFGEHGSNFIGSLAFNSFPISIGDPYVFRFNQDNFTRGRPYVAQLSLIKNEGQYRLVDLERPSSTIGSGIISKEKKGIRGFFNRLFG